MIDHFGQRIEDAKRGIFSVDAPHHRLKRFVQRARKRMVEAAYERLGLDRDKVHADEIAKLEATRSGGVWARSTGEWAKRREELDAWALKTAAQYEPPVAA